MPAVVPDVVWLKSLVRDIPDYPKPGVIFKDITPLLADAEAFRVVVDAIAERFGGCGVTHVVGIEARGFIMAAPVAHQLGAGFVPVRKPGKLPWQTRHESYELEYGTDRLEVHLDATSIGDRVLIVDDVLATGGTAAATVSLVEATGATVIGLGFLLELGVLGGGTRLGGRELMSLLHFD